MTLTTAQLDRAYGALLATAAGDALGAGYEFGPPLPSDAPVEMKGGGSLGWAPGEWTDDTAMAVAVAETAAAALTCAPRSRRTRSSPAGARGRRRRGTSARRQPGCSVPRAAAPPPRPWPPPAICTSAPGTPRGTARSCALPRSRWRSSPTPAASRRPRPRSAPSPTTIRRPARPASCGAAIRHAVLTGRLDARTGLDWLPGPGAARWAERLKEAEHARTRDFTRNGWAVEALQAAWCAIATTPVPPGDPACGTFRADHLRLALEDAVRGGRDADTVAAIAGGLLGAAYGVGRPRAGGWHCTAGRACGPGTIALAAAASQRGDGAPRLRRRSPPCGHRPAPG